MSNWCPECKRFAKLEVRPSVEVERLDVVDGYIHCVVFVVLACEQCKEGIKGYDCDLHISSRRVRDYLKTHHNQVAVHTSFQLACTQLPLSGLEKDTRLYKVTATYEVISAAGGLPLTARTSSEFAEADFGDLVWHLRPW